MHARVSMPVPTGMCVSTRVCAQPHASLLIRESPEDTAASSGWGGSGEPGLVPGEAESRISLLTTTEKLSASFAQ